MPSQFKIFQCHNDSTYKVNREISIIDFNNNFRNREFTLPKWQRSNRWRCEWRQKLIESIMLNSDIPKLFITNIKDTRFCYLIDGGHRARSINEYINNEFSINIDDERVYYDINYETKYPRKFRNVREMTFHEKQIFDNYKLSVTYYSNLTEREARIKFNELQNAQPMTMADVVNSHESPLVDFLREYCGNITHPDNKYLLNKMYSLKSFPCKKNQEVIQAELIYRIAALYTIYSPMKLSYNYENKKNYAMCSVVQGKDLKSPCLMYIKCHEEDISEIDKKSFGKSMFDLIKLLDEWKKNDKIDLSLAIVNSLYHSICHITNFKINKFLTFIKHINEMKDKRKQATDKAKEKNYELSKRLNIEADQIEEQYDNYIEEWEKTKRNGGSDFRAMEIRMGIIEKYCT